MQLSGIDITFQGKDTSIHVLLIVVKNLVPFCQ